MPRMTLMQHRLSCVASGAVQPLGKQVARSLVACIYKHRNEGITYGGNLNLRKMIKGGMYAQPDLADGAPSDIEVHSESATRRSTIALSARLQSHAMAAIALSARLQSHAMAALCCTWSRS